MYVFVCDIYVRKFDIIGILSDDDSSNGGDKEDNNEDNDNKDNKSSSESESEKPKAKAKKTGDDSWTGESISSESELS